MDPNYTTIHLLSHEDPELDLNPAHAAPQIEPLESYDNFNKQSADFEIEENPLIDNAANHLLEQDRKRGSLSVTKLNELANESYERRDEYYYDIPFQSLGKIKKREEMSEKARQAMYRNGIAQRNTKGLIANPNGAQRGFNAIIAKHGTSTEVEEYNMRLKDLDSGRKLNPDEQKALLTRYLAAAKRVEKVEPLYANPISDEQAVENVDDLAFSLTFLLQRQEMFPDGLFEKLKKSEPLCDEARQMKDEIQKILDKFEKYTDRVNEIDQQLSMIASPNYAAIDTDSKEFIDFAMRFSASKPETTDLSMQGPFHLLSGTQTTFSDLVLAAGIALQTGLGIALDEIAGGLIDRGSNSGNLYFKTSDSDEPQPYNKQDAVDALLKSSDGNIEIFDQTAPEKKVSFNRSAYYQLRAERNKITVDREYPPEDPLPKEVKRPSLWQRFAHYVHSSFYKDIFTKYEPYRARDEEYKFQKKAYEKFVKEHPEKAVGKAEENVEEKAVEQKVEEKVEVKEEVKGQKVEEKVEVKEEKVEEKTAQKVEEKPEIKIPEPPQPVKPRGPITIVERLRMDNETTLKVLDSINDLYPGEDKEEDKQFHDMVVDLLEDEITGIQKHMLAGKALPDDPGKLSKFFRKMDSDTFKAIRDECSKRDLSGLESTKKRFKDAAAGKPSLQEGHLNNLLANEVEKQKSTGVMKK